jgi:hypothetical protein
MVKSLISPEELEDEEAHVTPHTRRLFADRWRWVLSKTTCD